jgi:hypothetical protein
MRSDYTLSHSSPSNPRDQFLVSALLRRSFPFTCITGIQKFMRHHKFLNSKFYCKSVTYRFQIPHFISIFVPHRNQIHNYGTFLPIVVWLSRKLVFLMGLQRCHIQDLFASCTFNFNQPNKLLAFPCTYIFIAPLQCHHKQFQNCAY